MDAYASVATPRFLRDPQTLFEPDFAAPPAPTERIVCIVVVAANPLWLNKAVGVTYVRGGTPTGSVLHGLGVGAATFLAVYYGVPLIEREWAAMAATIAATGVIQGQCGTVTRAALEKAVAAGARP